MRGALVQVIEFMAWESEPSKQREPSLLGYALCKGFRFSDEIT